MCSKIIPETHVSDISLYVSGRWTSPFLYTDEMLVFNKSEGWEMFVKAGAS